jgi:hypothetical protein
MRLVLALIATMGLLHADDRHIGVIDFYGYAGLDLQTLREALPFHVGDSLPSKAVRDAAKPAYKRAIGRGPVEFTLICCEQDGRSALFVGMHEPGAPMPRFNAEPKGSATLSAEALQLYDRLITASGEAVRKGRAGEDDSQGYSLSEDPAARALGLKFHEYAGAHTEELYRVLAESRDVKQREVAAEALGFAGESKQQIAALVHASFDPSDDVRNNAIRALGVLLRYDSKIAAQVPLAPYIAMLHSSDWFDRNKTIAVLDEMTKSRDRKVLAELRAQALTPLREMAQWRSTGHALSAIFILGRMAGFDDAMTFQMFQSGKLDQILKAGK